MRVAIAIVWLGAWMCAASASAQTTPADPVESLSSGDAAEIGRAIDAIRERHAASSVRALGDRITDGLPPELLDSAVDALVAIGRPAARVLLKLANHRRSTVRAKVVVGLAEMRVPGVRSVLVGMLDDPNEAVRTAAARALGILGASSAIKELLLSARLGLEEAAVVLGDQVSAARVSTLLKALDADSLDAIAPALLRIVGRENVSVTAKRRVLARLKELASPASLRLLHQIFEALPQTSPLRVETGNLINEMNRTTGEGAP